MINSILAKVKNLIIISVALCIALTPTQAFALSSDFVDNPAKWYSSEYNISFGNLESISGYYQYYFDTENNTLCGHISYADDALVTETSEILVGTVVNNSVNNYDFTFNQDYSSDKYENFDIYSSFTPVSFGGQDIFFAIEFLNKADRKQLNDISFYLLIDKIAYPICENITLRFEDETTTKKPKETTTKKPTAEKTTKPKAEKTTKEATTKFKSSSTIKFKPEYQTSEKFKYEAEQGETMTVTYGTGEIITESNKGKISSKGSLSEWAILWLVVAVILVAAGLIVINNALKYRNQLKIEERTNNKEKDED